MGRFIRMVYIPTRSSVSGADGLATRGRSRIAFLSGMKRKTSAFSFRARILPTRLRSMRLECAGMNLAQVTQVISSTSTKKWVASSWRNSTAGSAVSYWTFVSRNSFCLTIGMELIDFIFTKTRTDFIFLLKRRPYLRSCPPLVN